MKHLNPRWNCLQLSCIAVMKVPGFEKKEERFICGSESPTVLKRLASSVASPVFISVDSGI